MVWEAQAPPQSCFKHHDNVTGLKPHGGAVQAARRFANSGRRDGQLIGGETGHEYFS
jgi:hypothetical protein